MKKTFENWVENGWLMPHPPERNEIARFIDVAKRDLDECKLPGLSDDWRFNIAYSSILSTGAAALAVYGYRAARDSHHYWVIQSLQHTLGVDKDTIDELDTYRSKRNKMTYEEIGIVSERDVDEIINHAGQLYNKLLDWMSKNNP